jgi:signal transduction histidine kinase
MLQKAELEEKVRTFEEKESNAFAIAGHELRVSVMMIRSVTEMLKIKLEYDKDKDTEKDKVLITREELEFLDKHSKQLERLCSDMLNVARTTWNL